MQLKIREYFDFQRLGTGYRRETAAGLTTFLTMAYIIFVQPAILSRTFSGEPTGLDFGAVTLATCLSAFLATLIMGLYANYPIAQAPGMGENFFFVSVVVFFAAQGIPDAWRMALGIVFVSGVLFLILSLLKVREAIINALSPSMKNSIAVGIGLFIAFIGLKNAGLILEAPGTAVKLNPNLISPSILIFFFGLLVMSVLQVRKVRGAIIIGILAAGLLALALGEITYQGILGFPRIEQAAAFRMDIRAALTAAAVPFIIIFLVMDMFDTVGTLVGVAEQAGFIQDNKLPRADQALLSDAVGTVAGACLGTSTVTSYIESATGVSYGGRSGFTSVVTAALFLLALFFGPLVAMVGEHPAITAPALVVVGAMMIGNATKVEWSNYSESIPAFLIILGIPLTYSIADGLALGFISYPLIKFFSGKGKEINWLMYLIAGILILYLLFVRAGH